jgi:ribonuclease HI
LAAVEVIMMTNGAKSRNEMPMRITAVKIYFDGGCRPNPGRMETGVVARGVTFHKPDCGIGDNNAAEWLALLDALEVAQSIDARDVTFLGDSALVVGQASRNAKCRSPHLQQYLDRFQTLSGNFDRIRVRKIPRTQNLAGIALAKARL